MIEPQTGNLLQADAEALVNPVNCVGVMGRGLALQFREQYPANFTAYKEACRTKTLTPGVMLVHPLNTQTNPRYLINFPTKDHWKGQSKLVYITSGLTALIASVRQYQIASIALPALGCGLGGLRWEEVRPLIVAAFLPLPSVRVLLFEPTEH